ncbi:hypothetical protein [Roseibium sp. RKSG952]|uniref:hypothetical protein n=1 Tax=Roseibium sp. RKSG952 TaxID=2529384 RepID=UPI0012BC18AC|nr:hypothetical protein [Roseibium sp. RKSG952]MTH95627.1 hypothetical protein [Roseibium sp. RKSG952]
MDLKRMAVSIPAMTPPGTVWDGSIGHECHNIDFKEAARAVSFVLEKGNPFTEIRLICDMAAEIQLMLPSVNLVLSPVLKTPLKSTQAADMPRYARHMHFDMELNKSFLYVPFGFSIKVATIFLSTEQFDDDFMRRSYRAVWDMLEPAIRPSWLSQMEQERMLAASRSEFNPTHTDTSIPEYLNEIEMNGGSPQVDRMMSWAGTGFESYLMNLRLLHTVPYIAEDEESGDLVYPRYASLYHAILNGEGNVWLHDYRHKNGYVQR